MVFFIGSILSIIVGSWISLRPEHPCASEEEERFFGDCVTGSPCLFLCILEHINILGDPLYFEVVVLHLIMLIQKVEGMTTCAPCLDVGKQHLWHNISI